MGSVRIVGMSRNSVAEDLFGFDLAADENRCDSNEGEHGDDNGYLGG